MSHKGSAATNTWHLGCFWPSTNAIAKTAVPRPPSMSEKVTAVAPIPETDQPLNTPPNSIFTRSEKRWIVFLVAYAGLFSPLSSFIYYPALFNLAQDLNVTLTMANLSITTYMLVSGIAPSLLRDMADTMGRRLLFLFAIFTYTVANVALAVQRSCPALLVLRTVQSAGSGGGFMGGAYSSNTPDDPGSSGPLQHYPASTSVYSLSHYLKPLARSSEADLSCLHAS
ncbi:major facilitator superfamily domain-containing protein [Alternaria rosae]|uniref:major facilitator superfamily domain-containing protein n=1 Tax=Alternaria rosae TaxID=1187941 RepID=UPI001E8E8397|nr:major facilitator superfamily domain-containing protein [Alternaria rosae]KAH6860864.1 major facilitator superfamily domain-containing protein [Alternaria rosae]